MHQIEVIKGFDKGKNIQLSKDEELLIGRSKQAHFQLNDPSISRIHAKIIWKNAHYIIVDQGSNNGLWLKGEQVHEHPFNENDRILVGSTEIQFKQSTVETFNDPSTVGEVVITPENEWVDDRSIMIDANEIAKLKDQLIDDEKNLKDQSSSQKQIRMLQAMLRVSNAVSDILDLQELLDELMEIIFQETKASRGFVLLYNEEKQLIPMSIKKRNIQENQAITISKTIINTVVKQKKAILSSDMMNDERFNSEMSIIAHQIRSCMCSPLIYRDEVIGAIHIDSDLTTSIFDSEDLELLTAIGSQAAITIKNNQLLQTVTEEENKRSKLSQYFPPGQVNLIMKGSLDQELGGKTETVTILFCDIRSFTSLSEEMSAEEVMNFLNDFFSAMTDIVFRNEGMVDNFMGDCIMAVFGSPMPHEDNPSRAVNGAVQMQLAQKKLNEKFQKEGRKTFEIGIGIHTGSVCRGNIGSPQMKKYTAIGSTVNVCARLCSLAQGGEILISSDTKEQLPDLYQLDLLPPVKVKNVSQPLTPYKVQYSENTQEL